jgi:signal transduction histidine kinase
MESSSPATESQATETQATESQAGEAAARVTRVLGFSSGAGGSVFNLLAYGGVSAQSPVLSSWFALALVALVGGIPVVMVAVSFVVPVRVIRILAAVQAITVAVGLVLWYSQMLVHPMPGGASPWLLSILAVPCVMAAIAWSARSAWVYTVLVCVGAGALRYVTRGNPNPSIALQDMMDMFLVSAIFVAIVQVARRVGDQLDRAAESARTEAAKSARSQIRQQESVRLDALLHDDVIATLLAAGRDNGSGAALLKEQAQTALDRIEILQSNEPRSAPYAPAEVVSRLRAAVTRLSGGIQFEASVAGEVPVPVAVVDAVNEAVAEAIRNSLRHAVARPGHELVRRVSVDLDVVAVRVEVSDTGQGFNPRRIPPDRFGIAISIRERLAQLPGGSAEIDTGDSGTTVWVRWDRL